MSENNNKVYRFRSKTQCILMVIYKGFRHKVKFNAPFNGISRFSTGSEELAKIIRRTRQFRAGQIVEDEPVAKTSEKKPVTVAKKPAEPKTTPKWVSMGKKMDAKAPLDGEKTLSPTLPLDGEGELAAKMMDAEDDSAGEAQNTGNTESGTVSQGELWSMTVEDVENYMDAKAYLRDTLGVGKEHLANRDAVTAYCKENGIVFPNFEL